jgi:DNA-binding MarR family transcriptional regulator
LDALASWREAHGLTAHQAEVLVHLYARGAATSADLARTTRLTTASMTRIVQQLDERGWVVRSPDQHDARRTLLRATKALARAVEELEHAVDRAGRSASRRSGSAS